MNFVYAKQYAKHIIKKIIKKRYLYNENLRKYQLQRINEIVKNARENSDFYKNFYADIDFELKSLDDIKKLPVLKKHIFKEAVQNNTLLSKGYNKKDLSCGHTTGSTGVPLQMCFDKNCINKRILVQARLWDEIGALSYKKVAKIWRDKILSKKEQKLKNARLLLPIAVGDVNNPVITAITNKALQNILKELQDFDPHIIRGYVSSLYSIASLIESQNIKLNALKSVIASAEYLPQGIWDYLEKNFQCPIYNLYGGTEAPSIAVNKKYSRDMEISEDLYFIEVLDENGNDVKLGEQGLITITDLHSYATPLIRYQIGDMAIVDENFYILDEKFRYFKSVEGRTNDIFELEDGSLIYSHLWFVYFREEDWISRFKVIQLDKNTINIKLQIIKNTNMEKLKIKLENIYPKINFIWEIVEFIEYDKGYKFRSVISMVENKFNKINKGY